MRVECVRALSAILSFSAVLSAWVGLTLPRPPSARSRIPLPLLLSRQACSAELLKKKENKKQIAIGSRSLTIEPD